MSFKKIKNELGGDSILFNMAGYLLVIIVALFCVIPFLLVLSGSFTSNESVVKYGYNFIPKEWSLAAYEILLKVPTVILDSYLVTIFITLAGTTVNLFLTSMTAFVLHRKDFAYRNRFSFFFFFTTLFSGDWSRGTCSC